MESDTVDAVGNNTKSRFWSIFPTFNTTANKSVEGMNETVEENKRDKRNVTEMGGVVSTEDETGGGNRNSSSNSSSLTLLAGMVKRPRRAEGLIEPLTDSSEDDDNDDDEPIQPVVLNWRTHPDLSDWTIEIVATDGKDDATLESYAVHKSVLSLESKYFAKLFAPSSATMAGTKKYFGLFAPTTRGKGALVVASSSRFEFPGEAATLVPILLDYMYDPSKLVFTTETAAIYYYFGQVFGMSRLRWEAKQFWTRDLSLETIASYYQQAIALNNPKLLLAVSTACAKEAIFLELSTDSALLAVPHVDVWLDLVQTVGPCHSKHLSVLIATFCQTHASVVDGPTFAKLLRADSMPVIDASVAFSLLDLECSIRERTTGDIQTTTTTEAMPNTTLSSLQNRCIDALQETWETMDLLSTESGVLRRQSPEFLVTLFERVLTEAQRQGSEKTQPMESREFIM